MIDGELNEKQKTILNFKCLILNLNEKE